MVSPFAASPPSHARLNTHSSMFKVGNCGSYALIPNISSPWIRLLSRSAITTGKLFHTDSILSTCHPAVLLLHNMPFILDNQHEDLRRQITRRNLQRLAKFNSPAPPQQIPEALSDELPDALVGAVPGLHLDSEFKSLVVQTPQPLPFAHPETHVDALLATVPQTQPKAYPQTLRSRIRAWLAMVLATWLGALGALLGAPRIVDFGLGLSLLRKWSEDNQRNILVAQDKQVFGGKSEIHWQSSLFAFMESTGMYLRDVQMHSKAWSLFQNAHYNVANEEKAIKTYGNAYENIDRLADAWGMKFLPIEMVGISPDGHEQWDGPFCGIFHTTEKQAEKPFIGIAFKGTNPINIKEWAIDLNYQLAAAEVKHFKGDVGAKVSQGVYASLFGKLPGLYGKAPNGDSSPYGLILDTVRKLTLRLPNTSGRPIPIHVTGHSLGGSYATMCYTQLLIDIAPSSTGAGQMVMGDEYTFGAPRVGCREWAALKSRLVDLHETGGQSWRIVNNIDLVPMIPPTSLHPTEVAFHHVNRGVRIWPHKSPRYMLSEQEQPDPLPYPVDSVLFLVLTILRSIDHREYNVDMQAYNLHMARYHFSLCSTSTPQILCFLTARNRHIQDWRKRARDISQKQSYVAERSYWGSSSSWPHSFA